MPFEKTANWRSEGDPRPLVSGTDFAVVAGAPVLALTSWLTNETTWYRIARKAAKHASGILSRDPETILTRASQIAGDRALALPCSHIPNELVANEIETSFQIMRDHTPSRWRPSIEVAGEEHLKSALSQGKGAVLWDSHFYFASLITKIGLHAMGYGLHHLSRREHGYSASVVGMKFVNPIRTSVERRYLNERAIIRDDNPGKALEVLAERLRQNAVVSITARGTAKQPLHVPFMNGRMALAPGAPSVAWKTGSTLIPVFTVRPTVGRYRIHLGPPIGVDRERPRKEAARMAAEEYAKRLEPFVVDYPGQWIEWINI